MAKPVGDSSYQSTFVQAPFPPAQQEENSVVRNMALTIPETLFLTFSKSVIQTSLNVGSDLTYLDTSEPMQRGFNEWVAKTFADKKFSPEELKLDAVVSSIWGKVKILIENELRTSNNSQTITIESHRQSEAKNCEARFHSQGRAGKFFTARQARALLEAIESTKQ
jgi:hypothetical protein